MEPEKKSNGAIVGLVIIILILVIGGIYIWQSNKNTIKNEVVPTQSSATVITTQDSADLNKLDADLQTTDTNTGVDANAVY